MRLSGKTALITGGSQGIGAAIVRRYREEGANVVIADIQKTEMQALPAAEDRGRVAFLECDVTDVRQVEQTCRDALAEFGRVDILVNNAGGSGSVKTSSIEDVSDDVFNAVLELNLLAIMRFTRPLLPAMKQARWGRIINMSSRARYGVSTTFPTMKCHLGYVVAKGAVVSLTTQFAKELGPFGITCNAISPGLVLPDENARITRIIRDQPADWQESMLEKVPVRRFGTGEDIAELALYLALPSSGFMTGQTLDIHGGVQ
jgi:NAD(P)-dependent dehydrogenase (short-subunit alcohol dehydrogenase family)